MVPTGYLDDVLAVFDRHNHRFVLLEEDALGWMGVAELGRQVLNKPVSTSVGHPLHLTCSDKILP